MDLAIPEAPAFHIGIAFLLGMIGQVVARHLRVPGIVVLLALGVAVGPDGLGWLLPATLGTALPQLVSFAVAIILFEGSLALDLRAVWHQAPAIRRLVTLGAAVTATAGALAAHFILGWEWPAVVLFGSLVVVTGPTVIQPILRRIRLRPRVATILEGEAILGDAIGATLAVVVLELCVSRSPEFLARSGWAFAERITVGVLLGLLAGALVALAVRFERIVPPEVRNALAFAIVVGFYQIGDALSNESGILVAIVAGQASGLPQKSGESTSLGVVATNAALTKAQATKVAQMAQDGLARTIQPVHTPWDGDTLFALATGERPGPADVLVVGALAAEATARAVVRAVKLARGLPGLPAWGELAWD